MLRFLCFKVNITANRMEIDFWPLGVADRYLFELGSTAMNHQSLCAVLIYVDSPDPISSLIIRAIDRLGVRTHLGSHFDILKCSVIRFG